MRILTRTVLALAAGALSLGPARAQAIANLDLETWTNRTTGASSGVLAPTNWLTDDEYYGPTTTTYGTLSRSTDRHGGTYAARLTSDDSGLPSYFFLGSDVGTEHEFVPGGLPYTGRPTSFSFYYKLVNAASAADSAYALMLLTRNVNGATQTVGYAEKYMDTGSATAFTLATAPVTYLSAAAPDSVRLLFLSGVAYDIFENNGVILDDISFNGAAATRDAALQAAVSATPNPSADGRFALRSAEAALLAAPLTVTDLTGRVVLREAAARPAAERRLDLSRQAPGLYTLRLDTERGPVVRKLTIR